jgi:hypothetical protein
MNSRLTLTIAWTWTALALGFWPAVIAVAIAMGW